MAKKPNPRILLAFALLAIGTVIVLAIVVLVVHFGSVSPVYYSSGELAGVIERKGYTITVPPEGSGPFALVQEMSFNRGQPRFGTYWGRDGKKKQYAYPIDPEHVTSVWLLIQPNGEASHLLASFVRSVPPDLSDLPGLDPNLVWTEVPKDSDERKPDRVRQDRQPKQEPESGDRKNRQTQNRAPN
jgi:hypothetical protein